jgi:DNA-directed RNA polymerase subunit M/transcription elongation factor TFIIS
MHYIGRSNEVVLKQCEQCGELLAYKSDGIHQPITCEVCHPVDDTEYISKWDIVLTNKDQKDYVILLGTTSADARETAAMCRAEIEKGTKQARGWINALPVPQGWPYYD